MPKIEKVKPKKVKKSKSPKSTHAYYCCCAEKTKQGLQKGTKITHLTQTCKNQAGPLMAAKQQVRESEKKKILENWKQIGLSLGKIIDNA